MDNPTKKNEERVEILTKHLLPIVYILENGVSYGSLFLVAVLPAVHQGSFIHTAFQAWFQAVPAFFLLLLFRRIGRKASLRTLVIPAQFLHISGLLILAFYGLSCGGQLGHPAVFYFLGFSLAAFMGAQQPGLQSVVSETFTLGMRKRSLARVTASLNTMRIVVPSIAGLIAASSTWFLWIFLNAGLVFLSAVLVLVEIRRQVNTVAVTNDNVVVHSEADQSFKSSLKALLLVHFLVAIFAYNIQLIAPLTVTYMEISSNGVGLIVSIQSISVVLGSFLLSTLVDKITLMIRAGIILICLSLTLFVFMDPGSLLKVLILIGVLGLGRGLVFSGTGTLINSEADRFVREKSSGYHNSIFAGSNLISVPVTLVALYWGGFRLLFIVYAVGCFVALFVVLNIFKSR